MQAKDIMITSLPVVSVTDNMSQVAQEMISKKTSHVMVTAEDGRLLGLISGYDLRQAVAEGNPECLAMQMMTPRELLTVAYPHTSIDEVARYLVDRRITQVPVVLDEVPVGYLNLNTVLDYTTETVRRTRDELRQIQQTALLIESMSEGLVVVDRDYSICEFNPAAERSSGLSAKEMLGKVSALYRERTSPVRQVMESGKPLYNVEVENAKGQYFTTNNVPIFRDGQTAGVLQTFVEVTTLKQMHAQLLSAKEELDKAFALTLPNTRVEKKLKTTPEYMDTYHSDSGLIEITGVIENGGYLHVVNALKVAADLNEKGLLSLLGVDKDTLVQALIFHDVGKSQPVLSVGQVVDPQVVFEDSARHAERSADIAKNFYDRNDDVVTLIRYHHHAEEELPLDFPRHLLPMFRLLGIIDGLSAGLTRREANISFRVDGSRLTVFEENKHPHYNRTLEVDLYTGQQIVYNEEKVEVGKREARVL